MPRDILLPRTRLLLSGNHLYWWAPLPDVRRHPKASASGVVAAHIRVSSDCSTNRPGLQSVSADLLSSEHLRCGAWQL